MHETDDVQASSAAMVAQACRGMTREPRTLNEEARHGMARLVEEMGCTLALSDLRPRTIVGEMADADAALARAIDKVR